MGTDQTLFNITAKAGKDFKYAQNATLKAATRGMQKELRKVITEETKPMRRAIKQSAIDTLPSKGGLNKFAAVLPSGKVDFRPKYAGIKIRAAKQGHDLKSLNKGRLRHPLFGNRRHWYLQDIKPGFFDKPIEGGADDLKRRIKGAIDAMFERIARE